MSLPEIPGYRIETLIGKGACGTVYTARHDSGNEVAVKLLNPKSVNAELLANRVNRLYSASPPKATVPLIAHSLEKEPYFAHWRPYGGSNATGCGREIHSPDVAASA